MESGLVSFGILGKRGSFLFRNLGVYVFDGCLKHCSSSVDVLTHLVVSAVCARQ